MSTPPRRPHWSGWQDLNLRSHAPEACALAGLSYILELAPMTRIELAFPDRQSGPFARWGHGQLVRSAGIEPTWSPTALSRRRVYQFRHEREHLGGPGRTRTDGDLRRRIKNPLPWPLGAQVRDGGSGWFRTTCARVKSPLHLHSGLTLRIHRLDGCGGQPRRFRVARHDGVALGLCSSKCGLALGGERRCTPAGRFSVIVISYARLVLP